MENPKTNAGNRLKDEKSPYLLQHANNPVDWHPWGEEAFALAAKEDKPIFLSIGYSTCHWCHVMEHESFEDPETAKLINEVFVAIKVDREERPDIDQVYMAVCQLMTGNGGWPLTILMTPDKKPFFAGTYIPKDNRFGQMGLLDLSRRVDTYWKTERDKLLGSLDEIESALKKANTNMSGKGLDIAALDLGYQQLSRRFDEQYAGFGQDRKFSMPHNLLFLMRYWKRSGDSNALRMVEKTLRAMRMGGIFDHVGFGFHRYSTDRKWLTPHFEKMLYDQALLTIAYTEAYQATGKTGYQHVAQEILSYVLRDMTSPDGGFYSAEDADSEGEEGRFYVWTTAEILEVLGEEEGSLFIDVFNAEDEGNFFDEATKQKTGVNIFHLRHPLESIAKEKGVLPETLRERIDLSRQKLFAHREKRIHPLKDDKILADWNGLNIAALAIAARTFDNSEYLVAAQKAVLFILKSMRTSDGRLVHRYREGQAGLDATLDDYAFFIWGLIEVYESSFQVEYLQAALDFTQTMIADFWDETGGAFYFTANHAETLLVRPKEIYDGALPSGNSVAAHNLLRLARISANTDFEDRADAIFKAFTKNVQPMPFGHTHLMMAVDFAMGPSTEVVIAGDSKSQATSDMLKALREGYLPSTVVVLKPTEQESPEIIKLAEYTKTQVRLDGKTTAYVCQNHVCHRPTTDIDEMLKLLKGKATDE